MGFFNKTLPNGQHRAVFKNLHGARAHEVDGLQSAPLWRRYSQVQKEVLMCRDSCTQQLPAGALEQGQLQDLLVQVHGDNGAELVRKVLQKLPEKVKEGASWGAVL